MPKFDPTDEEKSALCLQCMECCKVAYIPTPITVQVPSPALMVFIQTRGIRTFTMYSRVYVVIDQTCKHLTENGCSIYASRPTFCRDYDGRLDPLMKDKCKWSGGQKPKGKTP